MAPPMLTIPSLLEADREAIYAMLEPCLDLEAWPAGERIEPGSSKLFGAPLLPPGTTWPRGPEGEPMLFVAQLDLATLVPRSTAAAARLPAAGMLSLFCDLGALPSGLDAVDRRAIQLIWTPAPLVGGPVEPLRSPGSIEPRERALRAVQRWRLPSEVDQRFLLGHLDEERYEAYRALREDLAPPAGHQLLGPAEWLEEDPRRVIAHPRGARWRLLWQVSGESELSDGWGDDVRIYLLLGEEDLAAHRFERYIAVAQCP